ncbi:DEAD/DEAH box helicase [Colletotrichum graminicola]|uniref:ATP-dependent RNA helicase n=1 Tax=Colletotrichum graminicola (strain M1.001 / M2 / FGSC 10212) TaxID=645133 RepID=E3Q3K7_COLGM|nr:DEAD/DEAH box helicase [Colletotrichum graminicola M1.001]EFQ25609.1 DEAD/DEAH box helicase [Colletotrichum graminicola M1.001]WDK11061.1 DEAD/DEAH box helicase [Colletotrichum graminicola]
MDILKVLSRGIKQPPRGAKGTNKSAANLPSAGNRTNPQLFHDEVPSARGHKRKRGKEEVEEKEEEQLPEVDFFAPKPDPSEEADKAAAAAAAPKEKNAALSAPAVKPKLLPEDECRQILRSHRLKLTLLSERHKKPSKVTKSKKKKVAVEAEKETNQLHPQPLTTFRQLRTNYAIAPLLADNLAHQGYKVPTEVQLGALPLLLQPKLALKEVPNRKELGDVSKGVDFLAVAPTGSGKTISFLIPAINSIMNKRASAEDDDSHDLSAIIIAPTRELVFQIVNEGRKLAQNSGIKVAGMKKGMRVAVEEEEKSESEDEEEDEEKEEEEGGEKSEDDDEDSETEPARAKSVVKVDILVTTPALLFNFLSSGSPKTKRKLPTVTSLILDEADVLLDPLFREQTMAIWSACTNPELRTTFWSATFGSNIETLVTEAQSARPESKPLIRLVVGLKDTAVPNVTHKLVYTATEKGKLLGLRQLLRPTAGDDSGPPLRPPFLVFTQTIERATALAEELKYDIPLAAGGSDRIAALHSGLADRARADIMRRFRAGEVWILITTDVLARGVDFAGVNGVVNYDVPGSSAAYVHRAGRTGRAGREGGVAVTFYTADDIPFVKSVANVIAASEKQAGKTGDQANVQKWLLDALPNVSKADKKKLKEKGVEARRSHGAAMISSQSKWDRRKESNIQGATAANKQRIKNARKLGGDEGEEWGGLDD